MAVCDRNTLPHPFRGCGLKSSSVQRGEKKSEIKGTVHSGKRKASGRCKPADLFSISAIVPVEDKTNSAAGFDVLIPGVHDLPLTYATALSAPSAVSTLWKTKHSLPIDSLKKTSLSRVVFHESIVSSSPLQILL